MFLSLFSHSSRSLQLKFKKSKEGLMRKLRKGESGPAQKGKLRPKTGNSAPSWDALFWVLTWHPEVSHVGSSWRK